MHQGGAYPINLNDHGLPSAKISLVIDSPVQNKALNAMNSYAYDTILIENVYMHEYCVSLQVQLVSLHFLDSRNLTIIPGRSSYKSPNSCLEARNAWSSSACLQHWLHMIAVLFRTSHELRQFK